MRKTWVRNKAECGYHYLAFFLLRDFQLPFLNFVFIGWTLTLCEVFLLFLPPKRHQFFALVMFSLVSACAYRARKKNRKLFHPLVLTAPQRISYVTSLCITRTSNSTFHKSHVLYSIKLPLKTTRWGAARRKKEVCFLSI